MVSPISTSPNLLCIPFDSPYIPSHHHMYWFFTRTFDFQNQHSFIWLISFSDINWRQLFFKNSFNLNVWRSLWDACWTDQNGVKFLGLRSTIFSTFSSFFHINRRITFHLYWIFWMRSWFFTNIEIWPILKTTMDGFRLWMIRFDSLWRRPSVDKLRWGHVGLQGPLVRRVIFHCWGSIDGIFPLTPSPDQISSVFFRMSVVAQPRSRYFAF